MLSNYVEINMVLLSRETLVGIIDDAELVTPENSVGAELDDANRMRNGAEATMRVYFPES